MATTHFHLMSRLRMSAAARQLPLYAFMVQTGQLYLLLLVIVILPILFCFFPMDICFYMYILFSFIFITLSKVDGRFLACMGKYISFLMKTRLYHESVQLKIVTFFDVQYLSPIQNFNRICLTVCALVVRGKVHLQPNIKWALLLISVTENQK